MAKKEHEKRELKRMVGIRDGKLTSLFYKPKLTVKEQKFQELIYKNK